MDTAYNPDHDPFENGYMDNTCVKDKHIRLYAHDGKCYNHAVNMKGPTVAKSDISSIPVDVQHPLSTETTADAKPESDIRMLEAQHSVSYMEGKERAKGTSRIIKLEQPPWRTILPPRKPEHDYGVTQEGVSLHGRLSPWLYLCDHTCDLGLCDITFRLPRACPLGPACRWKHEILWDELSFLITSGRLNLRRARTMLANWESSTTPADDIDVWCRMNIIIDRVQYLETPAEIKYTYPHLFPVSDSHALFERLSDG